MALFNLVTYHALYDRLELPTIDLAMHESPAVIGSTGSEGILFKLRSAAIGMQV